MSYQKILRNFNIDTGNGLKCAVPCCLLRHNIRNLFMRKPPLYFEQRWTSVFHLQTQSLSSHKSNVRHYYGDERFCQTKAHNAKFKQLKYHIKSFQPRISPLGNYTSEAIFSQNNCQIHTFLKLFHSRFYGTEVSNQPLVADNGGLLKQSVEDIDLSKKGKVVSYKTQSNERDKEKKSSRQVLLKQAEKDFELINEKYEETRQNYIQLFPKPKSTLNNLYLTISSHLNRTISLKVKFERIEKPKVWEGQISIGWPEEKTFKGRAKSKQEAVNRAALDTLIWLQNVNILNTKGQLSLLSNTDVFEVKNKPVADITLSSDIIDEISKLLDKYSKEVSECMNNIEDWKPEAISDNYFSEDIFMSQNKNPELDELWLQQRNENLFNSFNKRMSLETSSLPISTYREEFLSLLKQNRVVVVTGEPGCGKSTQVPQFVFDDYASKMQGTNCKVVVTQPRRISAISLAEYIAYERNEKVGDVTGYQVRLKSVLPHPQGGGIIFCSIGILLRKIISDPGLSDISHVIIDEAHERDINTDFLLTLVKRAIQTNPKLKVVIMSATINAELFQKYFDNAHALHIPGFAYPVKQQFLDYSMAKKIGLEDINELCQSAQPRVDCTAVAKMVHWINSNRPDGAVLVFLPGWAEIQQTMKHLSNSKSRNNRLFVVPVHSKLNYKQQKLIFEKAPEGMRKIILATNIAETSITIDDVVYVVDTGSHKEERLNLKTGMACLDNHWVSAANVRQRQGRAGRVQPGESFHLFTKDKFQALDAFPTPEILRVPLEKSVLDCKVYSTTNENISDFFSQLPEPPEPKAVYKAVIGLQRLGALDSEEDLTPLGKRIYLFTTHPVLSKTLVYSSIFKCVNPVLTVVTLMSSEYQLFQNIMENKEAIKSVKQQFSPCSDHLALAWLYQQWEQYRKYGMHRSEMFCRENGIYDTNMALTQKLRTLNGDYLHKSQLIDSSVDYTSFDEECNLYSRNDEFVKAVLLSGFAKVLLARNFKLMKGRLKHCNDIITQFGQSASIVSDSVNHGRKTYPSPFLTYYRMISSLERPIVKIWDSSIVSPASVLLFLPGIVSIKTMKNLDSSKTVLSIKGSTPINITCDHEHAKLLLNLRQVMWTVVDYLVEHEGHPSDKQEYEVVSRFKDSMLHIVSKLVSQQGENIDYNEEGELRSQ